MTNAAHLLCDLVGPLCVRVHREYARNRTETPEQGPCYCQSCAVVSMRAPSPLVIPLCLQVDDHDPGLNSRQACRWKHLELLQPPAAECVSPLYIHQYLTALAAAHY